MVVDRSREMLDSFFLDSPSPPKSCPTPILLSLVRPRRVTPASMGGLWLWQREGHRMVGGTPEGRWKAKEKVLAVSELLPWAQRLVWQPECHHTGVQAAPA
jgi:hypothetical protein